MSWPGPRASNPAAILAWRCTPSPTLTARLQNLASGQTYVSLTDGRRFLQREGTSAGRGAYDRSRMTLNALDLLRTALIEGMG